MFVSSTKSDKPDGGVGAAAQRFAAIVGGPSLVAAAMYYFGWVRTEHAARAVGLEQSVLGYSATDYVLRGATGVIRLLFLGVLVDLSISTVSQPS